MVNTNPKKYNLYFFFIKLLVSQIKLLEEKFNNQ